jgi:hypothetical protein
MNRSNLLDVTSPTRPNPDDEVFRAAARRHGVAVGGMKV